MESHHQEILKPKNPQNDERKPKYIILQEQEKIQGTSTEKKINGFASTSAEKKQQPVAAKASFPPGYRFMPTDEELILEYLNKKANNEPIPIHEISDVYLKQNNPKALSETYPKLGENEWYFFTPRDRKYPNGTRPNRAADTGYWKATGADKPVRLQNKLIIGYKKALVFYEGKPPKGLKTSWIMHEFRLNKLPRAKTNADDMRLDDWVLCRIYKKASRPGNKNQRGNECSDPIDDQEINNRLQLRTDDDTMNDMNDDQNTLEVVDNNENIAAFDMPENIATEEATEELLRGGFGDHWPCLQNNFLISPPHSIDHESALINGHFQSSILDYGPVNTIGQVQHNVFGTTAVFDGQEQALVSFQHGDFQQALDFQQLSSYFGLSTSGSNNNAFNDSFMKFGDSFSGAVANNPEYNQFMSRKRRL